MSCFERAAEPLDALGLVQREDSPIFVHAAFASTLVEVGRGGARAFRRTTGPPREFPPEHAPGVLAVRDTLRLPVLGDGKPVAGIGVEYKRAADSLAAEASAPAYVSARANADGVGRLPLTAAGPWIVRAA